MRTLLEISAMLAGRAKESGRGKLELAKLAGVTFRTLQHVLTGSQDYKVSTLLAVADRLGLELVLVPREAARGLVPEAADVQEVPTRVQASLARLKNKQNKDA